MVRTRFVLAFGFAVAAMALAAPAAADDAATSGPPAQLSPPADIGNVDSADVATVDAPLREPVRPAFNGQDPDQVVAAPPVTEQPPTAQSAPVQEPPRQNVATADGNQFRGPVRAAVNGSDPSADGTHGAPGYRLGAGDKIRVIVYGEDDLGGVFDVDGSGFVRLPLIGQVQAAGLSVHDFEAQVAAKLADGYLNNPRVSAEVTSYRPFYIIGEVNKPGEYAYVNGMNVVTAVALAGGYTYRADESDVYVRKSGSVEEIERPADATTVIHPGDIIRVTERFF